jgi:serine/threonine protein phosphatase PrpC
MTESFQIAGITEKYHEKDRNGDYILYQVIEAENLVVAVLADGVSNSPCDWLSSGTACEKFMQEFLAQPMENLEERIHHAMQEAHYAVMNHEKHHGMLCAFAAVVWIIGEDAFHFINIGDTRIYHVSGEDVEQITADEADNQFLRRGTKIATDSSGYPLTRRVITNAVGSITCKISVQSGSWAKGDLLVLASDGFYNIYDIIEDVRVSVSQNAEMSRAIVKVWGRNMDNFEDDNSVIVMKRL